jgi:hypothetical protein
MHVGIGECQVSQRIHISSDQASFDAFTAQRECGFRAEGLFDVADMYRELRERLLMGVRPSGPPFDCESFDRGRTTALLKSIDSFPNHLTFYDEAGKELTVDQARAIGGWLPKRRVSRG